MPRFIKYYSFVLFCLIQPVFVYAREYCVPNDTVSILLDSSIGSQGDSTYDSNFSYDYLAITFSAPFSYGTVKGIGACLSSNYGLDAGSIYTDNGGVLTDNGAVVTGGETNGRHCFCKLLHPVVSAWMYSMSKESVEKCIVGSNGSGLGGCAQNCVGLFKNRPVRRATWFDSIEN